MFNCLESFSDAAPFLIGVFKGKQKPEINRFFLKTVEELLNLRDKAAAAARGFYVKVRLYRADRPARSTLKNIKNHSGYNSCERCLTTGEQRQPKSVCTQHLTAAETASKRIVQRARAGKGTKKRGPVTPVVRKPRQASNKKATRQTALRQQKAPATSSMKKQRSGGKGRKTATAAAAKDHGGHAQKGKEKKAPKKLQGVVFPDIDAPRRRYNHWRLYMKQSIIKGLVCNDMNLTCYIYDASDCPF